MDKPATLPDYLAPIWNEMEGQVSPRIGAAGLEALCTQVYRMRDAQKRISADGIVVADQKGNPAEHPALKIELAAQKEVREWIRKFPAPPKPAAARR